MQGPCGAGLAVRKAQPASLPLCSSNARGIAQPGLRVSASHSYDLFHHRLFGDLQQSWCHWRAAAQIIPHQFPSPLEVPAREAPTWPDAFIKA